MNMKKNITYHLLGKSKCDFYMNKYSIYIEYAGLLTLKNKISDKYRAIINKKIDDSIKYNYQMMCSDSVNEIIDFIKDKYEIKNNKS